MTTWTVKVDGVDKVMADHVNKLQTYKLDRDEYPYIHPEDYGAVGNGIADDRAAIQATIDAGEATSTPIIFSANYVVRGTLYQGNSPWIGRKGATLTIICDNAWSYLGTATNDIGGLMNSQGAIITKSTKDAGYGISSVAPKIDGLTITMGRAGACTVSGAFMYCNTDGGYWNDFIIQDAAGTVTHFDPFDFYWNCQNFNAINSKFLISTGAAVGGCWVRNYDVLNPTGNIIFSQCLFESDEADETIAVFTGPNPGACRVRGIKFIGCHIIGSNTAQAYTLSAHCEHNDGIVEDVQFIGCNIESKAAYGVLKAGLAAGVAVTAQRSIGAENCHVSHDADTTAHTAVAFRGLHSVVNNTIYVKSLTLVNEYLGIVACDSVIGNKFYYDSIIPVGTLTYSTYLCDLVQGNDLSGGCVGNVDVLGNRFTDAFFQDCQNVSNNTINLSVVFDFLFLSQGIIATPAFVKIDNNVIIDSGASAAKQIFYLTRDDINHYIDNNKYFGERVQFLAGTMQPESFYNNSIETGSSGTIVVNSSFLAAGEFPYGAGWFSAGDPPYLPIGHFCRTANPDADGLLGWVKISEDGSQSNNWKRIDLTVMPEFETVKLSDISEGFVPYQPVAADLVLNGGFDVGVASWSALDCTLASIGGGEAGNCLEITRTAGTEQAAYQSIAGLTVGASYVYTAWVKSGSSGDEAFSISNGVTAAANGISSGAWTQYSFSFVATLVAHNILLYKWSATPGTMLFDTASVKRIWGLADSPISSDGTIVNISSLVSYVSDAAAGGAGLVSGDLYTETGTDPLRLAVKS